MAKTETRVTPEFNIKECTYMEDLKEWQADGIAALYRRVYNIQGNALTQLSYPYPEALDAEWIRGFAGDKNVVWKVVTDTRTGEVIGSGTVLMNPENQRGYVRGVMIDPAYQGCGLSNFLLVTAYKEVIRDHRDVIKIFWTENRTAHPKSQKISENSGMRPVGLLPNKDIFLEKRETDIIYVLYSMNSLKIRRPEPQLIQEIIPIFETVGHQFRLDPVPATKSASIHANGYEIKGHCEFDKYLYHYWTFQGHGNQLKFMINPRTQVAEKTWFPPDIDPTILKSLLKFALQALRPNLFYMECYVSAYQPEIQRVFTDLKFNATGYLPGWNLINRQREDVVIMTWVKEIPDLTHLKLTRRATKIANLFLS